MIAFCSESGISREDVEIALRALSLSCTEDVPVLAARPAEDGRGGRVLFASEQMLALFRATDLETISARLFETSDPGAKRLAELSRSLPTESGPRLERLRFFFGPVVETVTFLCRKYAVGQEGPLLIAAALGVRAQRQMLVTAPSVSPRAADMLASAADSAADVTPVTSLEEIRQALAARLADRKSIRFLWRTDAEGKITEITPPLAEVVGAAAADLLGRDFGDVAKYLERAPDGPLRRAFLKRDTFSGIDVLWPIAGSAAAVPVSLGALPAFTSERQFDGYRGFGVIRLDGLTAAQPRDFMDGPARASAPLPERPIGDNIIHLWPAGMVPKAAPHEVPDEGALDRQGRKIGPLSDEEETAFREIATVLADDTADPGKTDLQEKPESHENAASVAATEAELPDDASIAASLGRHAPMIFDRLGVGILISRGDVPIYANRYLLAFLGYADEDAFHAAGGMAGIFEPVGLPGSELICLRTASGAQAAVRGRLQTIDWEGLPATLFTLRQDEESELRGRLDTEIQALKTEASELTAILDTATDGLAVIDARGCILTLNRSGEALFGYDQGDVIGQPFTDLIAPESRAKAHDYFAGLQSDRVASLLNDGREIIGRARQGGDIPIFLTLGRIGSGLDQGVEQKYCALMRDMTHWKKVERDLDGARREAERASALKSDFLAKISHEIRTPLNAILGFAEVIVEERFGPIGNERYRDYLKDIHSSGAHVMSLVNDLLDLSKIEAGGMDLDFVAVDSNQVISECVGIMQLQANRERVIMRLALAQNLPKIMADERSLRQIILNLLSNAVKFNEPGGQVIIATALTDAGDAVIRIRDTGIGMSEVDIETALEPFRQVATSRQTTGTGLGLPLTKALVEANRASFSIKSRKNEGTLVEVAFPPERLLSRDSLSA
jgi:PAS domain S-box-containing protein